jgi:hypothetical protein
MSFTKERLRRWTRLATAAAAGACATPAVFALPAFPGAEGFGTETIGGRGGSVCVVTSTSGGTGTGTLRNCLAGTSPRIVVFRVSGVIQLTDAIDLRAANSFVTVLGQTSPGGITITGDTLSQYGPSDGEFHDAVFRFLRFRRQANTGGQDVISFNQCHNIVWDHTDFSGGADETFDMTLCRDFTVQWSTVTNSRSEGGNAYYGWLLAYQPNQNITIHHNLSANHNMRCGAQLHWDGSSPVAAARNLDIRNNVYFNCQFQGLWRVDLHGVVLSNGISLNLIGNTGIAGANSPSTRDMLSGEWAGQKWCSDNAWIPSGNINCSSNIGALHAFPAVTTTSRAQAYDDVLAKVGSWPRDAMNVRTIAEVVARTGQLGKTNDVLDTDNPTPPVDTDVDGIPDAWETAHGLNPNNSSDSAQIHSSGYANIEVYANELAVALTGQAPPPIPSPPTNLTAN